MGFIFSQRYTGTYDQPQASFTPLANLRANWELPILFLRPYVIVPAFLLTLWAARRRAFVFGIATATWVFIASILVTSAPRITFWLPATVPLCLIVGAACGPGPDREAIWPTSGASAGPDAGSGTPRR